MFLCGLGDFGHRGFRKGINDTRTNQIDIVFPSSIQAVAGPSLLACCLSHELRARSARSLTQINVARLRLAHVVKMPTLPEDLEMTKTETQVPVKIEAKNEVTAPAPTQWPSLTALRSEIDRLFEDFDLGSRFPFRRAFARNRAVLAA